MAKARRLSCLEKRSLLNRSAVSVDDFIALGKFYERSGLVHDAVDFYERANAKEALEAMLAGAKESGDVFLFNRICRILNRQVSPSEWLEIAETAEKLGKLVFAQKARSNAGVSNQEESPKAKE